MLGGQLYQQRKRRSINSVYALQKRSIDLCCGGADAFASLFALAKAIFFKTSLIKNIAYKLDLQSIALLYIMRQECIYHAYKGINKHACENYDTYREKYREKRTIKQK